MYTDLSDRSCEQLLPPLAPHPTPTGLICVSVWVGGSGPGSEGHYQIDAEVWAEWQGDYLKVDFVSPDTPKPLSVCVPSC